MEIVVFLYGIIIGSFLNVCIYRIPREESIGFPPSHCTSCNYRLRLFHLIPILSYVALNGRCKSCGEKISLKYPVIEVLNGIVYLLLFFSFGISLAFIKYCIFTSIIIVIGMIDFETTFVYRSITKFAIITGIILIIIQAIYDTNVLLDSLLGAIVSTTIIFLIVTITRGMGEGDIEIAAICGLFLGLKGVMVTLFLSFILGGAVSGLILILKLKGRKDEIPFGPYLAIGAMIAMLYGNTLLELYVRSFI